MSYFTQRLANTFPMWSKVRSDPSSNGYRWLESFAKQIELERINAIRLANFGFFSNVQEVANLYFFIGSIVSEGFTTKSKESFKCFFTTLF